MKNRADNLCCKGFPSAWFSAKKNFSFIAQVVRCKNIGVFKLPDNLIELFFYFPRQYQVFPTLIVMFDFQKWKTFSLSLGIGWAFLKRRSEKEFDVLLSKAPFQRLCHLGMLHPLFPLDIFRAAFKNVSLSLQLKR